MWSWCIPRHVVCFLKEYMGLKPDNTQENVERQIHCLWSVSMRIVLMDANMFLLRNYGGAETWSNVTNKMFIYFLNPSDGSKVMTLLSVKCAIIREYNEDVF